MNEAPIGWRRIVREHGLIEWVCPHGVGHPAPADVQPDYVTKRECWGVHGCDGCCHDDYKGDRYEPRKFDNV